MSNDTFIAEIFRPLKNQVFVTDMEQGEKTTKAGIIIRDDNMREHGIHPRWGKVYAVGPDCDDIKVGDWILMEHGRWTLKIDLVLSSGPVKIWRVDYPDGVLLVSDTKPES